MIEEDTPVTEPQTMPMVRWYAKANAFAAGWAEEFGYGAPLHAVVMALAIAQHETRCGDSWPGTSNWGATQLRPLTPEERLCLSSIGLQAAPANVEAARARLTAQGFSEPAGELHVDSSPGKGWYWVFFRVFPSDTEGARFLAHLLAAQHPTTKAVLLNPAASERDMAVAMYGIHYYEGVHVPASMVPQPDGGSITGVEANIRDYTRALLGQTFVIRPALASWVAGMDAPVELDLALIDALVAKDLEDVARGLSETGYVPRGGNLQLDAA